MPRQRMSGGGRGWRITSGEARSQRMGTAGRRRWQEARGRGGGTYAGALHKLAARSSCTLTAAAQKSDFECIFPNNIFMPLSRRSQANNLQNDDYRSKISKPGSLDCGG